ncbi:unnamed protein product [Parnassius mnemosyne]|uniref:PiggyBac transposable element-derived protein domain-containing protein n=1 Tax=Parnassius mnemosyne TaxID=213953 RepID=A0AAV1KEN1_9NEOP
MDQPGPSGNSRKRKRVALNTSTNEKTLSQWIEAELERDFSDVDDEEVDPDFCLHSDHDSASEQSEDEETQSQRQRSPRSSVAMQDSGLSSIQDNIHTESQRYYIGKNGFKWSSDEQVMRNCRSLSHNLVDVPRSQPKAFTNLETLWRHFMDDDIADKIIEYTNKKLAQIRVKYKNQEKPELRNTDAEEMKAFFGLLFYSSVFKSNHENAKYIFATDGSGREIFRAVMSQYRFLTLLNCIRFDDVETRQQRLETDKLAAISDIFEKFISNCKKVYVPGAYLCVDEMLVPFRGRCKFIIYMPKKPAKYGLKMLLVCDAETFYVYNAYIYCGKESDGLGLPEDDKKFAVPTQSVLRLCKDFENTNRNITADNWFSSYELMEQLKQRGLTYVGTLKKNKRHIPPEFQASKTREPETALHGFTKDFTLVSYVPKKSKAVLLISSMHHTSEINPVTKKPVIIMEYNKTKGGVDEVDKKCSNYSCSRRTRRWPLAFFFRLLDLSGVNAFVLYRQCADVSDISRGRFLQDLARELVLPHLQRRVYNDRLPRELRLTMERILGEDLPPEPSRIESAVGENDKKTCKVSSKAEATHKVQMRCMS